MPRAPKFDLQEVPGGYLINIPASISESGKRERYVRAKKKDAQKLQRQFKKRYHQFGKRAAIIPERMAGEAMEASRLLEPFGATILDAAREYASRRKAAGATISLSEAWEAYQERLAKEERSDATQTDYKRTKAALPDWFLKMEVASIEGKDIERGLDGSIKTKVVRDGKEVAKRGPTWNRRLREVRAVINWATNSDAKAVRIRSKAPPILTVAQARKVMTEAAKEGAALPFALMLFAGIRPQGELARMSWGNIGRKYITLTHEETKTMTDRQIPISKNLAAWIKASRGEPSVTPTNWEKKRRKVRSAAGIEEEQDILRHTFGSCFYRIHGEAETVEAMGHHNIQTLLKYYKRSFTLADARTFFTIAPSGVKVPKPAGLRVA